MSDQISVNPGVSLPKVTMFTNRKGHVDQMRVAATATLIIGGIGFVVGLIGFMLDKPQAAAIVASSSGLIAVLQTAKAWQSQAESRMGE